MRTTQLKQTTAGIIALLAATGIILGLLRGLVMRTPPAEAGRALFEAKGCAQCHYTNSTATKIGPGLKGIFDREKLPVSKRPATAQNIRRQLRAPYRSMPSFADRLTERERTRIIEYLRTL
jgi:mono/diheme cytochrome c family protein